MKEIRISQVTNLRKFKMFVDSKVTYLKFFSSFGYHFYFIVTTFRPQVTKHDVHVFIKK